MISTDILCSDIFWGDVGKSYMLGLIDGGLAGRALGRISRRPRHLRSSPLELAG